jgi:hypothetical protein
MPINIDLLVLFPHLDDTCTFWPQKGLCASMLSNGGGAVAAKTEIKIMMALYARVSHTFMILCLCVGLVEPDFPNIFPINEPACRLSH